MIDYLLTNILISVVALISYVSLVNSPARLKFYLLMFAVVSWLIPWQYLPSYQLFDTSVIEQPLSKQYWITSPNIQSASIRPIAITAPTISANNYQNHLLLAIFLAGIFRFTLDVYFYLYQLKNGVKTFLLLMLMLKNLILTFREKNATAFKFA
ncbi:MAG: bla regulator protein BlaR1 [Flavobacteriales bacterium]|jgi:bla regulator protein BlaR1